MDNVKFEISNGRIDYITAKGDTSGVLHVPDSVRVIDDGCFMYWSEMSGILLPEGITRIGDRAFLDCRSLQNIPLPESLAVIDDCAFLRCESLRSIRIPKNVSQIGKSAFGGCTNLSRIEVDERNPFFTSRKGVLYDRDMRTLLCCPCGSSCFDIPESVTRLGDSAFRSCGRLERIRVPGHVKHIGRCAFKDCGNLREIHIDDGVAVIGEKAFAWCGNLEEAFIPESVREIGYELFERSEMLSELHLPSHLAGHLDDMLSGVDDPVLLCIRDFAAVPENRRFYAAVGFACEKRSTEDKNGKLYMAYIAAHVPEMLEFAAEYPEDIMPDLLPLLMRHNLITIGQLEEITDTVLDIGDTQLTAAMLAYKHSLDNKGWDLTL